MNFRFVINPKGRALLRPYQAALRRYLKEGPAASRQPALALGRRAAALGLETLDLALVHDLALAARLMRQPSAALRDRTIARARAFFAEAILPMEETHRSALEANAHLYRLNQTLRRRTLDLAASNRQLKKEVACRRAMEEILRRSEQQSGRLLDQSRHMQRQLQHLSRRILSAQEEERRRISRELHDVIAQMLTGINVRLATLKREVMANTRGLGEKVSNTQRLVEKSVDVVHRFAYDLRPAMLDDLGLIPALHAFLKRFTKATGIRTSLTACTGVEALSNARRTALYRVAQESLANVARHAKASRVDVTIEKLADGVRMHVKDNGVAFDAARILAAGSGRRMGLLGMRERVEMVGGRFGIDSSPGRGTTVTAQMPLCNGAKERLHP